MKRLISSALVLALLLCLAPMALADGEITLTGEQDTRDIGTARRIFNAADAVSAFPDEEPGPAVYPVTVTAGQTYYAAYEDTVYNNGGLVYNNGGLVYNNNGTVYNNDGVTYNNGGTVYANGGEVFNSFGTAYSNGAAIYDYSSVREVPASFRVVLAQEISPFASLSGLRLEEGQLLLEPDGACVVVPKEGYHLFSADANSGRITVDDAGALTLEQADVLTLNLRFQADPPRFDKAPGTYGQVQTLELSAAEGAEIYYWLGEGSLELETARLYTAPILLDAGVRVTAVAVADGAEISEPASADYAILRVSVPVFPTIAQGELQPGPQPLLLRNLGALDAVIESVSLAGEGAEAFVLSGGRVTVPAGSLDDKSVTLYPAPDLTAGSYSATVQVNFEGGSSVTFPISFAVK